LDVRDAQLVALGDDQGVARIQLIMGRLLLVTALTLVVGGCGRAAHDAERSETAQTTAFASEGWRTDFSRHNAPLGEFQSGGPPKDGIPAIDSPKFVSTETAAGWLAPKEPVIEVTVSGQTRAYPIQVLIWHEIANDELAGVPIAVTFCPLCNTAIVFDRRVKGRTLDFGTTGKLRNSDLVMYDRQTESWWQQFGGEALVGRYAGTELRQLPARIVSWAQFKREHSTGRVLWRDTGYSRPYGENPYQGYDDVASPPLFPTRNQNDDRLQPKERVVFLERRGEAVVIPYSTLERRHVVRLVVGGHRLVVRRRSKVASPLDSAAIASGRSVGTAEVLEDGKLVAFDEPFWFVVAAFSPDARVIR
jgi:hypothetical protein